MKLTQRSAPPVAAEPTADEKARVHNEVRIAAGEYVFQKERFEQSEMAPYACPECSGTLSVIREGPQKRFRCHTGHAYSQASLLSAVSDAVEVNLVSSMRALEEGAMLLEEMAREMETHSAEGARPLFKKAAEAQSRARKLHELATSNLSLIADTPLAVTADEK